MDSDGTGLPEILTDSGVVGISSNIIVGILSDIFPTKVSVVNTFRPITNETVPMKHVVGILSIGKCRNFIEICDEFSTNFFFRPGIFDDGFCHNFVEIWQF